MQASNANQEIFAFSKRSSSLKTQALKKAVITNLDLCWNFLDVPSLPDKIKADLSFVIENISDNDDRWWSDDEVKCYLNMMSL